VSNFTGIRNRLAWRSVDDAADRAPEARPTRWPETSDRALWTNAWPASRGPGATLHGGIDQCLLTLQRRQRFLHQRPDQCRPAFEAAAREAANIEFKDVDPLLLARWVRGKYGR